MSRCRGPVRVTLGLLALVTACREIDERARAADFGARGDLGAPPDTAPGPGDLIFQNPLEIHYINVGWGSSVLVRGPDGTSILMEAGNQGAGAAHVVPYLLSIDVLPDRGLSYTIAGHQHCDHIGGLAEVVHAGYDVHRQNFFNGSAYDTRCVTDWNTAAASTTAGVPVVPPVGSQIPLGDGARLTFVAVNGAIIGGETVAVTEENDRSIGVLIQYGGFDFLWASDLGGGNTDSACTGRSTPQADVETSVIRAISPGGGSPLISAGGIDVLHVNHHGSESSTNANWMNLAAPGVAVIAVGGGQAANWNLPRIDVVDKVLLGRATRCVTVAPPLLLQTEDGDPSGPLTSFSGYSVGDIRISTDGQRGLVVAASGRVAQGQSEVALAGLPRSLPLDEARAR